MQYLLVTNEAAILSSMVKLEEQKHSQGSIDLSTLEDLLQAVSIGGMSKITLNIEGSHS